MNRNLISCKLYVLCSVEKNEKVQEKAMKFLQNTEVVKFLQHILDKFLLLNVYKVEVNQIVF